MFTMLGDAHDILDDHSEGNKFLNISFKWLEEGIIVDKTLGNYIAGDVILSMGCMSPKELNSRLYEVKASENDYWIRANGEELLNQRLYLRYLGLVNDDDTVDVKVLREGKTYVFRESFKEHYEIYEKRNHEIKWSIEKENNLGYFRFDEFASGERLEEIKRSMDEFFKQVSANKIGNIAIDLRYNGGGVAGALNYLCRYLKYDKIYCEGTMLYGMDNQFPKADRSLVFSGNTYVMTSNESFSCSVFALSMLRDNDIVRTIGEPTGEPPAFLRHMTEADSMLPGSGWSFMMVGYKPKRPNFRDVKEKAFFPDIPVYRNRADLLAGRDPVMEEMRRLVQNIGYVNLDKVIDMKLEDVLTIHCGNKSGLQPGNCIIVEDKNNRIGLYKIWLEDTVKHVKTPIQTNLKDNVLSARLPAGVETEKGYNLIVDTGEHCYSCLLFITGQKVAEEGKSVDVTKPSVETKNDTGKNTNLFIPVSGFKGCFKPWGKGLIALSFNKAVSENIDYSRIWFENKDGIKLLVRTVSVVGDDKITVYIRPSVDFVKDETYKLIIKGGTLMSVSGEKYEEDLEIKFVAKL
jgi:hypothetical protein